LKTECVNNYSDLLKIRLGDHDYFKNNQYKIMKLTFNNIKTHIDEIILQADKFVVDSGASSTNEMGKGDSC